MILEFLTRDVAVWGGLKSPLLSWLGCVGLLLFFGWQVARLFVGASRAAAPFAHIRPLLIRLARQAEASDARTGSPSTPGATDLDRLEQLDQAMREANAFRRPWVQYRRTLLTERVPWATEPRVFSTRQAKEFLTPEATLSGSIDLAFSSQVPSLITGFGLLFTFMAICVGLGRLHADGQTIIGIPGLINGLAGKFLTSIVGLICANLFVLLERPAVRRLLARHAECLTLLDESFPRRTAEDLLDALGASRSGRDIAARDGQPDVADRVIREVQERLAAPIAELASAVRALSDHLQDSPDVARGPAIPIATRHRWDGARHRGPRVG